MGGKKSKSQRTVTSPTWLLKLADERLCGRMKHSMGGWCVMIPYLPAGEQVGLQLLCLWAYDTGVMRAQRSFPVAHTVYFPCWKSLIAVHTPLNTMTIHKPDFDSSDWVSVQVNQHIFQAREDGPCRWLENTGESQFRVVEKAPMKSQREASAFCSLKGQYIVASGGVCCSQVQDSVERYDIDKDVWEEMPQLQVARQLHASCSLERSVYAICGENSASDSVNSMEQLDTRDLTAGWKLIEIPSKYLTPRFMPAIAALNKREILIMGGYKGDTELQDSVVYNTRTGRVRSVAQKQPAPISFVDNACLKVRSDIVVGLDFDGSAGKLVEYRQGAIRTLYEGKVC